jgi:hypothetical protein
MNISEKTRSTKATKGTSRTPAKRRRQLRAPAPIEPCIAHDAPVQNHSIGSVGQLVRSLVERIGEMASALGAYEALLAVLVLTGIFALQFANAMTLWPIFSLTVLGVVLPLVARLIRPRD